MELLILIAVVAVLSLSIHISAIKVGIQSLEDYIDESQYLSDLTRIQYQIDLLKQEWYNRLFFSKQFNNLEYMVKQKYNKMKDKTIYY